MRRADGQMVQLGPLMYALLDEIDGRRDNDELAAAMCSRLGRACEPEHVTAIAGKLAEQGLLVGSEDNAPERINPLLALRWKVLITNQGITDRITRPFVALFRPWILVPVVVAFLAVLWFVLIHKGVASATSQAFRSPELFLLVIGLAVVSAAFHEIGHASACRYGGGRPGGMGAGIYMVWPAFYTDVTDAYRLPKRDRLRTDLGGLFFNSVVAVVTLGAWLLTRADVLLLLIALQLLEMVKNLSPMIRSDGYHVLSDATGVPDLYAHMVPTLKSVLPGQRNQAGALTGRARVLVTAWVLIIVPVLLSMALSAILLLPKLAASTYESGSKILSVLPDQVASADVAGAGASLVRLVALALPVLGSVLITQRLVRGVGGKAWAWSAGHQGRRLLVGATGAGIACLLAWAWWPSGQYQPVRASDNGTILGIGRLVAAPASVARPRAAAAPKPQLSPGKHLAVALIPQGGATKSRPAIFVIKGKDGEKPVVLVSSTSPPVGDTPHASQATQGAAPPPAAPSATGTTTSTSPTPASVTAFDFKLPAKPGPNDSQALAVNRDDGKTKYTVAYSLVTVRDGDPVNERNGAYAFSNCTACKTVAVSFQLVLIVGTSRSITPINVAEALNGNCPSCITTAIADQIVVTLKSEPSPELVTQLNEELKKLDAIKALGDSVTPAQVAQQVIDVQKAIDKDLADSGLLANPPPPASTTTTTTPTTTTTAPTSTTPTDTTPAQTTPTTTSTTPATTTPTSTTPSTTTTQTTPAQTTTTP